MVKVLSMIESTHKRAENPITHDSICDSPECCFRKKSSYLLLFCFEKARKLLREGLEPAQQLAAENFRRLQTPRLSSTLIRAPLSSRASSSDLTIAWKEGWASLSATDKDVKYVADHAASSQPRWSPQLWVIVPMDSHESRPRACIQLSIAPVSFLPFTCL